MESFSMVHAGKSKMVHAKSHETGKTFCHRNPTLSVSPDAEIQCKVCAKAIDTKQSVNKISHNTRVKRDDYKYFFECDCTFRSNSWYTFPVAQKMAERHKNKNS